MRWTLGILVLVFAATVAIYVRLNAISGDFGPGTSQAARPIPEVLGLLAATFLLYLAALWLALRLPSGATLAGILFVAAIVLRLTWIPSVPIQEIDIYRYLWDGAVTASGANPYRYPPDVVKNAATSGIGDPQLRHLVELRDRDPALATILNRVHFGHLPTVYPPVSQAIFAAVDRGTAQGATVRGRLNAMKWCLMGFDLATLAIVMLTLRTLEEHIGWSLAYGWCPLLLKEITNSGHLDAIAMFFSAWAVYVIFRATRSELSAARGPTLRVTLAAVLLALGVGAKLYPVLLAPVLAVWLLCRTTGRSAFAFVGVFAVVTTVVLIPLFHVPRHSVVSRSPGRMEMGGTGIDRRGGTGGPGLMKRPNVGGVGMLKPYSFCSLNTGGLGGNPPLTALCLRLKRRFSGGFPPGPPVFINTDLFPVFQTFSSAQGCPPLESASSLRIQRRSRGDTPRTARVGSSRGDTPRVGAAKRQLTESREAPTGSPTAGPMPLGTAKGLSATDEAIETAHVVDPSLGLRTFLSHWEMNDFLFLLVVENLKPRETLPATHRAWFAVTPASFREFILQAAERLPGVDRDNAPFLATKLLLTTVFVLIAAGLIWHAARRDESLLWGQTVFLVLAWFWLLCPTQNPWYWTWTLPFLPLMRNRLWLAVSGLALLYYLRFWFEYQWGDQPVGTTPYPGAIFFDMVIPWIEFGPWLVLLALSPWWRKKTDRFSARGC